jgi:hypothetical protein
MFGLLSERNIAVEDIKNLHHLFFKTIDEAAAGVWRDVNIIVTGSGREFPSPAELKGLTADLGRRTSGTRSTRSASPQCFT